MHLWILNAAQEPAPPSAARDPIDRAVSGVIGSVGCRDYGTLALSNLNLAISLD